MARVAAITTQTVIDSTVFGNALITDYMSQTDTSTQTLSSTLNIQTKELQRTITAETLGLGIATFAAVGEAMEITGDGGGNNVTTITSGVTGQILILTFVDANVTVVNNDGHGANTIDLVGAGNLAGADDTLLMLFFDGTSWYELSRSVN